MLHRDRIHFKTHHIEVALRQIEKKPVRRPDLEKTPRRLPLQNLLQPPAEILLEKRLIRRVIQILFTGEIIALIESPCIDRHVEPGSHEAARAAALQHIPERNKSIS